MHLICMFFTVFIIFCLIQYRLRTLNTQESQASQALQKSQEAFTDKNEQPSKDYLTALSQLTDTTQPTTVQGPPGPPGPIGPPGAEYTAKGRLLNRQYKLAADRFFGTGPNVAAYLAKDNLSSHQTWTLQSDNQLANQFGGCLTYSSGTNGVYIGACTQTGTPPATTNQWIQDPYGRIVSQADSNMCLTVSTTTQAPPGVGTISDNNSSTNTSLAAGTPILTTATCDMTPTQSWYIG